MAIRTYILLLLIFSFSYQVEGKDVLWLKQKNGSKARKLKAKYVDRIVVASGMYNGKIEGISESALLFKTRYYGADTTMRIDFGSIVSMHYYRVKRQADTRYYIQTPVIGAGTGGLAVYFFTNEDPSDNLLGWAAAGVSAASLAILVDAIKNPVKKQDWNFDFLEWEISRVKS